MHYMLKRTIIIVIATLVILGAFFGILKIMSRKLKIIFSIIVLLFILHGLEEYFTGFYEVNRQFLYVFNPLFSMSVQQATFLLFQISLWSTLIFFALLITSEKWRIRLMIIPGVIVFYEVHHIIEAFIIGGYYPGLITAVILPILGIFFWKELLANFRSNRF